MGYDITNYTNYLKPSKELPKHITFEQYKRLRNEVIDQYYDDVKMPNRRDRFLRIRDKLLMDFIFATGGRIGDVVRIEKPDIDFQAKVLTLNVKKSKKQIKINIDDALMYDISNYFVGFDVKRPFDIGAAAAWHVTKKFGRKMGIDLHPHMFRHGLALHLLAQGVPIPIISYRLGHSSPKITMEKYMIVTPNIEKQLLQGVEWR
jgi:integrase/recombinase XerD